MYAPPLFGRLGVHAWLLGSFFAATADTPPPFCHNWGGMNRFCPCSVATKKIEPEMSEHHYITKKEIIVESSIAVSANLKHSFIGFGGSPCCPALMLGAACVPDSQI